MGLASALQFMRRIAGAVRECPVARGPFALLRRLPRTVGLLVAGTFVNRLGSFIIPYLTLVLNREFHLSASQTGLLVSAYGAGTVVSMLAGGYLTDRLGRRRTLLLSLAGSGTLAVAMGLSPSVRVFAPLLIAFAFLVDLYRPPSSAIIADLLPSADRALGFAALRMAINLGFGFGILVGGFLADVSWRLLFWGDGTTTLLFGAIVYLRVPETQGASPVTRAAPAGHPLRDGVFLLLLLSTFVYCLAFFVDFIVLPLTVTASAGYPAHVYGFVVSANGFLIAAFELTAVDWLRRFRRLRVAALGVLLTGTGLGIMGLVMHWAWFLLAMVLITAGEICTLPQQSAFLADWAPPEMRGRYLGMASASWGLGASVAPVLFLPLHARLSERVFWGILGLVVLPSSALMRYLDRTADHPERLRGRSQAA
jgi:MFS family permease